MTTHTTTARRTLRLAAATTVALVLGGLGVQGASAADAFSPPHAEPDFYTIVQGGGFESAISLLSNDWVDDSGVLTVDSVGVPSQGEIANYWADGTFQWASPSLDFVGDVTFEYTIRDSISNLVSAPAVVTITVTEAPAPTTAPDFYSIPMNTMLNVGVGGLLLNDSLQFPDAYLSNAKWDFSQGQQVQTHPVDGSFTYMPPVDFVGTFTFEYKMRAWDGFVHSDWTLVTIEVTEPAAVIPEDDPIPTAEIIPTIDPSVPVLAHTGPVATALIAPALALLSLGLVGIYFAGRRTHSFI